MACAQKVNDEMSKWGQEIARDDDMSRREPSEGDMRRVQKIVERLSACMTDAYKTPTPDLEANPYGMQSGGVNRQQ
jgi:hypothetical protein